MTTVKQVFDIAMALADSQVEGNSFDETNDEYKDRTPQILNVLQNELANVGKLRIVIDKPITETGVWNTITLPDDLDRITKITILTEEGIYVKNGVRYIVESNGDENILKVKSKLIGTLKIEYLQIPEMISSMNDTLRVSDRVARSVLPYGLVANLFVEENPTIASFAEQKYEENKNDSSGILAPIEEEYIELPYGDMYGNY